MNILGFDCAGKTLSAGLLTDTGFYAAEARGKQNHSERIMDMADYLLKTAGITPRELSAAACMKGPGSFTGLRIGFSTAKGLSLSLGIPLVSVPTLDCMAHSYAFFPGIVVPLIDAKKNSYFTALYRGGKALCPYLDAGLDNIASVIAENLAPEEGLFLTGADAESALPFFQNALPGKITMDPCAGRGRARELLNRAKTVMLENRRAPWSHDEGPLYIRKSDAELNTV
ncbi:MAG: tRNA (adenosine(37)-N6)-threonylcarbamoyltransferase complex dimerization subunit type 1 TsaB [Treponema sp.]|nr:tRNA (adenosine(37)-N6)-threonylcarbamoyltransferase complex dimerization subunit type 1 TsaB [Treponema sp.]